MSIEVKKNGKVRFSYDCETSPKSVLVAGSFNDWEPVRMRKQKTGEFVANLQVPLGTHEYKFVVDDAWVVDPDNDQQSQNSFGAANSILVVS